ncbi:MAG: hypothetical protein QX189_15705 [Methylococcales bacterium]
MFDLDRTFCQRNDKTGLMEWYFNAREGIFGPYVSKQMAIEELKVFVERRRLTADDGGRSKVISKDKLSLAPIESEGELKFFDFSKRKKGIDE